MTLKEYYFYIMASKSGTLYIGMTGDLKKRVWQHKKSLVKGFSKKYKCHKLVYLEKFKNVKDALAREKQVKKWGRDKKEYLIKQTNPGWRDLALDFGMDY